MAEESDLERSYPATPRRLEKAREQGQVARSRELSTAAVILASAMALSMLGPAFFDRSLKLVRESLAFPREAAFDAQRALFTFGTSSTHMLTAILPLLGLVLVATLAAPLLISGWIFSVSALRPNFARLNPTRGLRNMISTQSVVELVKSLAKALVFGSIGTWAIMHLWSEMQRLAVVDVGGATIELGHMVSSAFYALVGGLVLIALLDVPYQLWRHYSGLRMTREEIREEQREMEGDPQQKARVRNQQRALARKRMMAAVPKASVVVTNPTHYAVALEYGEGRMRAPRVVAKGANLIAQKIRELAAENAVPIVEAPPLARALYRHTEIGSEIPHALYAVVAQVLAYVHQVRRARTYGGAMPDAPKDLAVPSELDPASGAGAE
jgi:flagellar biosynthetic protein FlhB